MSNSSDDVFRAEFLAFSQNWEGVLPIYDVVLGVLMGLGLVGNTVALVTIATTKEMRIPTFAYHGALLSSYLLFCLNFFALSACERFAKTTYEREDGTQLPAHSAWVSAAFSGLVYPALNTALGFMILYTVSLIALDRVLAYHAVHRHAAFNRWPVCRAAIAAAVVLSVAVHSWAPLLSQQIVGVGGGLFVLENRPFSATLAALNYGLNRTTKIAYPILILILAILSVLGARKRNEFRERSMSFNSRRQTATRDLTAFALMIGVVILAFIQVIPSEARRALQALYPIDTLTATFLDGSLRLSERLWAFRLLLYGYEWAKLAANVATAVERSVAAYLYIFLNHALRRHLWRGLSRVCKRRVWGGEAGRSEAMALAQTRARLLRRISHVQSRSATPLSGSQVQLHTMPSPSVQSMRTPV